MSNNDLHEKYSNISIEELREICKSKCRYFDKKNDVYTFTCTECERYYSDLFTERRQVKANKKDANHDQISTFVQTTVPKLLVKDCSTSKDGSQDVDWYLVGTDKVLHIEYKTRFGKLTETQKRFRRLNPWYVIHECRGCEEAIQILTNAGWIK